MKYMSLLMLTICIASTNFLHSAKVISRHVGIQADSPQTIRSIESVDIDKNDKYFTYQKVWVKSGEPLPTIKVPRNKVFYILVDDTQSGPFDFADKQGALRNTIMKIDASKKVTFIPENKNSK